jgi:hypothetical protein
MRECPAMRNYLYLDYGGREKYRRELKFSLIGLLAGLDPARARIVVYTDAPGLYAQWPVTAVDIAGRLTQMSGGGAYWHRVKPAVVLDALRRFSEPVCFLDSDSIITPDFHAELAEKAAQAVVMNGFEKKNPWPGLKGFSTMLPHLGHYAYDSAGSVMHNSGLIGMTPAHIGALEDTLALIDALIGRAKKMPTLEQFALSEILRLNAIPVAEIRESFFHYWQGRKRIYMAGQIRKKLAADWNDLTPPRETVDMNYWKIRAYNYYYPIAWLFAR